MSEQAVLLVIEVLSDPAHADAKQAYLEKSAPIAQHYGGQLINTYRLCDSLNFDSHADALVIMSFPNFSAINDLFADEQYKQLIPLRKQAFKSIKYTTAESLTT